MQLESHEVTEIIDSKRRKLILAATAAAMEGGTEADMKGAAEFAKLINEFTGSIARAIQEAEDRKVGAMVDAIAEEYADRCLDCEHWDVPRKKCEVWDQRGSSGPCDLFKRREGSE